MSAFLPNSDIPEIRSISRMPEPSRSPFLFWKIAAGSVSSNSHYGDHCTKVHFTYAKQTDGERQQVVDYSPTAPI